jgi:hypothetical protein
MKQQHMQFSPLGSERTFLGICLATLVVALPPGARAVAPAQFGSATNFAVGYDPRWIAAADLNQDGKLDIVTANWGSSSVSILQGVGSGAFTNRTDYPGVSHARGLAVGHFNWDPHLDVVVLGGGTSGPYSCSALLGDGAGGFAVTSTTNNFPSPVVASGDFNGDGKPDLATLGVSVAFGRGDASFGPVTNYSVAYVTYDLAAGDLNGDGKLDLVTSDYSGSSVSVLSNKGNGTFSAPARYPGQGSEYHYSVALADFNGDGKLDVATVNYYAGSVSVFPSLGNGLLGQATNHSVGFGPNSLAAGDFNHDGRKDLVVRGSSSITVLLGNGDGSFTPGITIASPFGSAPRSMAVGDFNGDGKADLALAVGSPGSVQVLLYETPPSLELELIQVSGHIQITWHSFLGAGYSLEFATNLSTGVWQPFPYPPVVIGERSGVTDFVVENKFYRLKK